MIRLRWPRDTLSRWVALTIAAAMAATLALNAVFGLLAGVWARPPLAQAGLLDQAAAITRVLDAAAPGERDALAAAAGGPAFSVHWWPRRDDLALPAVEDFGLRAGATLFRRDGVLPRLEGYDPDDWPPGDPDARYLLRVQLSDDSWLSFETPARSWGLSNGARLALLLLFGLLAVMAVAGLATTRLVAPLRRFSQAARRFGSDHRAAPIAVEGPLEMRQAINAFNAMQAQIQHFVQDRTQMLAAISHDLRAPLTRMRLRGEFIEDPAQQQRLFRDVDEMQSMIAAALAFFRDEARMEPATPFDLAELLQTLLDDYRDQGVDVRFEGPPRYTFHGRPLSIKRAVGNLLDNAIQYASRPCVSLHPQGERVVIDVDDQGPGIPDEHLEQVFAPFFRLESSRNRSTGGIGLGLSSARAAVLEQGGTLRLENRPQGGARARISLPVG